MPDRDRLETARKFAAGITRMLEIRGMSKEDLVQATGLGYTTIHRACCGHTTTNIDIAARIAKALNSPLDNLFSDPG